MPTSSPVTVTFTERTSPRFSSIANVAAALVAGMGACALLGWIFGVEVMKTLIPGATVMLPNTAMLFIVCGIALRLLRRERERGSHWLRMGQLAAAFTTVIGALMFTERMTGWDLGIDLLLFADAIRPYPFLPPGLPATNSLLCFLLAGIALLTLDWEPARGRRPAQWMAIGGLSLAGLAIVGYLFGARGLYAFDRAGQMALFTAVGFFTLHGGILFARPEQGGIALLSGHNLGSSLARRLIGATVGVPVVLGWIWLRAREQSMVSREAGIAINTVMTIGVLTGLVLQAATALRASDAERESLLMRERSAREDAESAP